MLICFSASCRAFKRANHAVGRSDELSSLRTGLTANWAHCELGSLRTGLTANLAHFVTLLVFVLEKILRCDLACPSDLALLILPF
jgi:hypothetical protein